MARTDDIAGRIASRVEAVISAIDAGEDPQPAIDRLARTAQWEQAAIGLAALQDAMDRMREADGEPSV